MARQEFAEDVKKDVSFTIGQGGTDILPAPIQVVVEDVGQIRPSSYTTPFQLRSIALIMCLVSRSDVATLAGRGGEVWAEKFVAEKFVRQVLLDGARIAGSAVKDVIA